ncbi:hypothetical protein SGCOL_007409 [Colletotrichum sp. CLE4]
MTTICAAAFHSFPDLPVEIRSRIWELTVEPRAIEVRVIYHQSSPTAVKESGLGVQMVDRRVRQPPPMRHLRSSTPTPAQLQTCREARGHLSTHRDTRYRYEKAFSEITKTPYDGFDPVPEGDPQREHYVWFNFDKDVLSVGDTELSDFRAVAHQICRLRLERALSNEYFSRTESLLIKGIRSGYSVTEDMEFPCGPENVYFVDPQDMGGMMINSVDLDAMVIMEGEDLYGPEEEG